MRGKDPRTRRASDRMRPNTISAVILYGRRPLTVSSDDPDYCSALDRVLRLAGRDEEAEPWRARAMVCYDELLRQHPAAFALMGKMIREFYGDNRRNFDRLTALLGSGTVAHGGHTDAE